jgi:hypothetical protein
MKNPLVILALASLATFTMGWFAHRVFTKTRAANESAAAIADSVKTVDSPRLQPTDTLLARIPDTAFAHPAQPEAIQKPEVVLVRALPDSVKNINTGADSHKEPADVPAFNSKKAFSRYGVSEKYTGKPAKQLIYSTARYARLYKAATKKAFLKGPNFAGRYAFAISDCGNGCFAATVTDIKTGKVYDAPHASAGYQYKVNSSLLIVNPPPGESPCDYCETEYYVWTGRGFKKIGERELLAASR